VQHPGKTAFSAELSRFFMACPGKCFPKKLILQPSVFEKSLVFKRDFDFLKMFTAVVRRPALSAGVLAWGVEKLRCIVAALLSFLLRRLGNGPAFSPPCKGGVRGGGLGKTYHCASNDFRTLGRFPRLLAALSAIRHGHAGQPFTVSEACVPTPPS
jgi:hypothetical protein